MGGQHQSTVGSIGYDIRMVERSLCGCSMNTAIEVQYEKNKLKEYCVWYLLLLIPIAGTIIFNVYPLLQTITDSFQNMKNTFIGGVNCDILFKDAEFGKAVINTL